MNSRPRHEIDIGMLRIDAAIFISVLIPAKLQLFRMLSIVLCTRQHLTV